MLGTVRPRSALLRLAALLALAGFAALPVFLASHARADCGDAPEDVTQIWTVTEPAQQQPYLVEGTAPLRVTILITGGVINFGSGDINTVLRWGDGSQQPVQVQTCPDPELSFWPQQSLTHVYASAGQYQPSFHITSPYLPNAIDALVAVVNALPAQAPTPVPPTPTTVATTAPTSVATSAATAERTVAAGVTPDGATATATPTETPTPTTTVAASTTSTSTPTATPTPAPARATEVSPKPSPGPEPIVSIEPPNRPDFARDLPEIGDVATSPDVVVTNVVIAGVTVWVLFTSVLLNQVLQDNRAEVERRTAWVRRAARLRRRAGIVARRETRLRRIFEVLGVLLVTGAIYTLAEPGLGFNRQSATLFVSVVLGVGAISYVLAGAEIFAIRRITGARAAIRPYAATIAVAVASVAITKLFDLRPGVLYGFIASTAVLGAVEPLAGQKGRIALTTAALGILLSLGAWLLVGPVRSAGEESDSWLLAVAEATLVVIFVGGIEGTFFSMIPIAATDGGKLFQWNRVLWAILAVAGAFLMWHVLLGHEDAYFSGLREARSLTVIGVFLAYTVLTVGLWWYFRARRAPAEAGPVAAG